MNSSANQISPIGPSRENAAARPSFRSGRFPWNAPDRPPPGGNMPSRDAFAQGGKLGQTLGSEGQKSNCVKGIIGRSPEVLPTVPAGPESKQPLTLFACVPTVSSKIW